MHKRKALLPLLFFLPLFSFAFQSLSAATSTLSPPPSPNVSLASDALALLAFKAKADVGNKLHFSVKSSFDHCQWQGVKCAQGKVVRLVLEGQSLRGTFAANTLTRLDQLRVLSLQNNSLYGQIPDLSRLINIKSLFLNGNAFSGNFPPSIFALHRIRTLDLSHNKLTGPMPVQLLALDRLYYLRLESNRFNGTIPPLNQSSLQIFNVSGNYLSGAVPATPVLSGFPVSAFSGNPGLCGEVIDTPCQSHSPFFSSSIAPAPLEHGPPVGQLQGLLLPTPTRKRHKRLAAIVALCAGILLVFGFLVAFFVGIKRLMKRRELRQTVTASHAGDEESIATVSVASEGAKTNTNKKAQGPQVGKSGSLVFCAGETQVYTLEQLMRASAEMLGRGTVGTTYKAVLDNQLIVSVKRLDASKMVTVSKEAFERHMESVGNLRHPNLVPLRAFFQAKEERLLIYDYQPNGSLFSLIHGSRSTRAKPLHWTSCLKIAEDVAQGLAYIHQASRLVHGNVRSSNVLLGTDFEACLTDYCLIALVESASSDDVDSGYRAPETRKSNQRVTPKSDVFGFGVLLLELLTGRPPLQQPFVLSTDLTSWVRSVREQEESEESRLLLLLDIATSCIHPSPEQRPTMWQVLKMILEVKATEMGENEM